MKAAAMTPTTDTARTALVDAIAQKDHELTALRNALAWLDTAGKARAGSSAAESTASGSKSASKARATRSQTASKEAPSKKSARVSVTSDEPRARKGKIPTRGVQQLYCETLADRQEKLERLKAAGFQRVGPTEKLRPGTYDVRPSGDGDDSSVVLWRDQDAEVAGE